MSEVEAGKQKGEALDRADIRESREAMSNDSPDLPEVEARARDYIEGWYTGNVERMDRALHEALVKRLPGDESPSLKEVTRNQMLEMTAGGGGKGSDSHFEVFVDDVSTDIAAARVLSSGYLDYLHLVKTSEGWKIANVLFHRRD